MKNLRKNNVIMVMLLVISILGISFSVVSAAAVTPSQVADKFNASSTVATYKEYGYNWSAKSENNKLIIP